MEMMLSQLTRSLSRHAEVHVIGPAGEETTSLSASPVTITRPKQDGLPAFLVTALTAGTDYCRRVSPTVIVGGSALVAPVINVLGRLFQIPTAVHIHGLDLLYENLLYQSMVRVFLPRIDHLFANSQMTRHEAVRIGVSPSCISVLNPGLDYQEFCGEVDVRSVRSDYNLREKFILFSAGRLARRKGLVEFVREVLPTVVATHPETALVIVGDNPTASLTHKADIRAEILAAAAQKDVSDHVELLGFVERTELVRLFHASDIFLLPAISRPNDVEGFGIVLIEASAAGKPVVAARLGGIPDAVADGISGILVEPEDWSEMASTILRLIRDEELRERLGQQGQERARDQFDWPIVAQRCIHQLAALVQEND